MGAWVLVAIIGPPVLGVAPGPTWLISGVMTILLLSSAGVSHRATTQRRRDLIGMGQQFAAAIAILALSTVTGTFNVYALPGVMVAAFFGFSITRHPFTGAVLVGCTYCFLFVVFALGLGFASELLFRVLILVIGIVAACVGAYTLERSQRTAFAQGRLVTALREQVDQLLHRYLSPEVATSLIEDPNRAELGGQELEVTVLFADLRGYTEFAERRAPTEVVAMLNAAFGVVVPIVFREGGTVVQFMGDALMAIFNAPHPQPDHALRAARAALAMQRAVTELPEGRASQVSGRPQQRTGPGWQYRRCRNAQLRGHRGHDQPRGPSANLRAGRECRDRCDHLPPDSRPGHRPAAGVPGPEREVAAGRGLRTDQASE